MSKTACWGTNRLDVDIAEVYCGYGSKHDMCWTKTGFQVSFEALKALLVFDYDYIPNMALELYSSENKTHWWVVKMNSFGITEEMIKRSTSLIHKHANLLYKFSDLTNQEKQNRRDISLDILSIVPESALVELSPISITFKHLSKKEEKEKASKWFNDLIPFIGLYEDISDMIEIEDNEKGNVFSIDKFGNPIRYRYEYIGYPKNNEYSEIANKIIEQYKISNDRECATYAINETSFTDMYLNLDKDAIQKRKLEEIEKQRKNEDIIKEYTI